MLSVSKLSPGQEAYYERSVAGGLDDYYAGRGESPGVWAGRGAVELQLEGVVGDGELGRLINGRHPLTSALLHRHPPKKQITVERIDPQTGERRLEQKTLSPVAGYDLVFSPPKSVSLLFALADEGVRHAVNQAHLAAWQATLAYLEQEACVTRKGKNGVTREHASGFVAAAYQHRTSRAHDPHLHTHVIVANMAKSPDGTWRALDGEAILKNYRLAGGYLYQSHLRHELTRTLGIEWRAPEQGMAEIAGVPDAALQAFSQRRRQVLDYLERQGTSGFYAAKVAAIQSRDRKEEIDLPRLTEQWRASAEAYGFGRRELEGLLGRARYRALDQEDVREIARGLLSARGLTERQTTFTKAEVVMAWAQAHVQGEAIERVLPLADDFVQAVDVVRIASTGEPGRPATYSTAELVRHERAALALVEHGCNAGAPTASEATVEHVVRRAGRLGEDQQAMVHAAASSCDRVVCVVGRAGSGKTTAVAALAESFACDGVTVIGCAPSGVAAEKLRRETRIPSTTLHKLVQDVNRHGGLPAGCVLVVDEAGMADTRTLTQALMQVERAAGKAILVGDPAQLPAVGAGGLFGAIVDRYGAIELTDNHRQRDQLEQDALNALRHGDGGAYLAHAAERERLVVSDDATTAKAQLVSDWWRAARDDLAGSVMVAYRRRDVADLNQVARAIMQSEGRLGSQHLVLETGVELAVGDRVVCLRNDRHVGVTNGTLGTVTGVNVPARTIILDADDARRRLTLPATYLEAGHVSHAYALTGHKTQGLTVERAFVLANGEANLKEWGYAAFSRAREHTRLYVTAADLEPPDVPPAYRPERPAPLDRLAKALTRTATQPLAIHAAEKREGAPTDRGSQPMGRPVQAMRQGRLLVEQQREAEKQRADTVRRLQATESDLARLGTLARARRGRALRDQISEQREAVARADAQLRRMNHELHTFRNHIGREAFRPSPQRPGRAISRTRELDLGR